jgi:Na+-translocating ferredoxin:NAD+ oxidoreductase RnfD subunit
VRFARTPKGSVLLILLVLLAVTGRVEGARIVGPGVATAVLVCAVLDAALTRWRRGRWAAPDGGVITGLLIASVLSSFEPLRVVAVAAAVAMVSKHVVRIGKANVFNPAALGLVVVFHAMDAAQNWWGALLAIVPGASWPLLVVCGVYVARRVNRLPLMVAFLATYFTVFTAAAFVVDPAEVSEVFVAPDLLAAVFCALFMLTDPPTSPTPHRAQLVCGVVAAIFSAGTFLAAGLADYLLVGVLAGNLVDVVRRKLRVTA